MTSDFYSKGEVPLEKGKTPETSCSSFEGNEEMLGSLTSSEKTTSTICWVSLEGEALALALAVLGVPVFPVNGQRKTPLVSGGFYDATTDEKSIRSWWAKWPDARVGYWTGAANLVVIDLDEKNGISGVYELDSRELDYQSLVSYRTPSGGSHCVFRARKGRPLKPATNYLGLRGVDIRAGGSYAIWYGGAPSSLNMLPEAPDWLYKDRSARTKATIYTDSSDATREPFGGDINEWIDWLGDDVPWFSSNAIRNAISSQNHIGHGQLLNYVIRIHKCRLEGEDSLKPVFIELVDKFQRTTNNYDGWQNELEDIIRWVIGAEWTNNSEGVKA